VDANDQARIVRQEDVGPYWVSTVFLGLDHNWLEVGPPRLFETLVFRTEGKNREVVEDAPFERSPTWEMALERHAEAVVWARNQLT